MQLLSCEEGRATLLRGARVPSGLVPRPTAHRRGPPRRRRVRRGSGREATPAEHAAVERPAPEEGPAMDRYDLGHLPAAEIIRGADVLAASDRGTTAELVAHIAEIDAQRLYEGLGFESTYAYCLGRLHLSEDAAYKRIQVARVA